MSESPLPDGWINAYDQTHQQLIWVDTKTTPPRVIWTHPYEDEQFLEEHPDVKARPGKLSPPPSYVATIQRRHSLSGGEASSLRATKSHPCKAQQRGVFGKLKDRAIGTKEEREGHRRARAERQAQHEEEKRQERLRDLQIRAAYMRLHGGYAPYHSSYAGSSGGRTALGASTLVAGLAGGLILGDLLSSSSIY
ncbi:hypothetical protein F5I97DRAFT_1808469 [Phlebopus sp. FC_14]|nr:hypothetical protein F5I97DRAFT_1808469 [Phlebopus sp. FC_14]